MQTSQILLAAMGDATLSAKLVKVMCQRTPPAEPPFLATYSPKLHEPALGTLWPISCHLYLLAVEADEELGHWPESSLLQEQVQLTRELFCEEVRRQFNLKADSKRKFAVCQGFQVCLVAEETRNTSDFTVRFAPDQFALRFVEDMMPR